LVRVNTDAEKAGRVRATSTAAPVCRQASHRREDLARIDDPARFVSAAALDVNSNLQVAGLSGKPDFESLTMICF
jgi:hypothetical protein